MRKQRNLKIGVFPEISAPDARADAIQYRGEIIKGRLHLRANGVCQYVPGWAFRNRYLGRYTNRPHRWGISYPEYAICAGKRAFLYDRQARYPAATRSPDRNATTNAVLIKIKRIICWKFDFLFCMLGKTIKSGKAPRTQNGI